MPAAAPSAGVETEAVTLQAVFVAHPDALLAVNALGRIVLSNPAATVLLGYSQDELREMSVDALLPEAMRQGHAGHRARYALDPRVRPMGERSELWVRCRDGSEVQVEIALSPIAGDGPPLVLASVRAVAAYPRVKQALQRARYSQSLARLGHGVVDARDLQTVLDLVPQAAIEALEVDVVTVFLLEDDQRHLRVASGVGEVPGQQIGTRIPYDTTTSPGLVLAEGRNLIIDDYRCESRFPVLPAYLQAGLLSAAVTPVHDRGRMIGALAARSRTPSRFGGEEMDYLDSLASFLGTCLQRRRSDAALHHAQTLESVGQLSGGIAHDFNNLLTVIQGNLEVLAGLPADALDGNARDLVGIAARAARRAAELTAKLLAFSRRQVLQPVAVDVGALISSLADMLRRTLDRRIDIVVLVEPACPPIEVDAGGFEAALLNIAINARDAMPHGGELRFEARGCDSLPEDVRSELAAEQRECSAGFVAVHISDNGCGMSAEVRERAFEPFFTTKPQGRGTGLGLSTVFGFVKQSHGALRMESAPGRGTRFTLFMPRATARQAPDAPAVAPHIPRPGLRVMLVEDDAEVRAVTLRVLGELGCQTDAFASAETALQALPALPDIELLLSDVDLGSGLSGTALATAAQRARPALAVLIMSGFAAELLAVDEHAPDGWELLAKPFSREELTSAVASAMARQAR